MNNLFILVWEIKTKKQHRAEHQKLQKTLFFTFKSVFSPKISECFKTWESRTLLLNKTSIVSLSAISTLSSCAKQQGTDSSAQECKPGFITLVPQLSQLSWDLPWPGTGNMLLEALHPLKAIPYCIVLSKTHGLYLCFKPQNLHAYVYTFILDFQTSLLVLHLLCNPVVQSVFPHVLYYVGQDDGISPPCLWSGLLPALMRFTLGDPLKSLFPLVFSTDITGFHPFFPTGSMSAFFNYMKVTEFPGPTTF